MSNYDDPRHEPDPMESRLRDALTSEAAMVEPAGDGLQKIRLGIEQHRRPWWQHPGAILAAAAVAGLAVGGVAFALGGDDGGTNVATSPSPSASATDQPSPTSSSSDGAEHRVTDTVFVYYVHDDGQSPRLYREQHDVTALVTAGRDEPTKAELGVFALLNQEPVDPDYASPWPAGVGVRGGITKDGDTATVDLTQFLKQGAAVENAGVQALVYTVTANDPTIKKVRLLVGGEAPTSGHGDWSEPVAREPMVDIQGLVWLLTPTQGDTVSSPVKIEGFGTATEGTISWEVRKEGVVVEKGFTQGGANGEFGDFTATVDLAPGDYEISAFESSAKDGSPIHIDTKNFTVK
jgi:hypothetical protein